MQRVQEQRSSNAPAARADDAAAAAKLVAPLLQLKRAASDAGLRLRHVRALELFERTLAAAEALPLQNDSLVVAFCISCVVDARTTLCSDVTAAAGTPNEMEVFRAVWRNDARALSLAQRALALYHARWAAGTLFTLSPHEAAFFVDCESPVLFGAETYVKCTAVDAVCFWPPLHTPAEEEARARGVHGALRIVMDMHARPDLQLSLSTIIN
jgi:hypothetical protein